MRSGILISVIQLRLLLLLSGTFMCVNFYGQSRLLIEVTDDSGKDYLNVPNSKSISQIDVLYNLNDTLDLQAFPNLKEVAIRSNLTRNSKPNIILPKRLKSLRLEGWSFRFVVVDLLKSIERLDNLIIRSGISLETFNDVLESIQKLNIKHLEVKLAGPYNKNDSMGLYLDALESFRVNVNKKNSHQVKCILNANPQLKAVCLEFAGKLPQTRLDDLIKEIGPGVSSIAIVSHIYHSRRQLDLSAIPQLRNLVIQNFDLMNNFQVLCHGESLEALYLINCEGIDQAGRMCPDTEIFEYLTHTPGNPSKFDRGNYHFRSGSVSDTVFESDFDELWMN